MTLDATVPERRVVQYPITREPFDRDHDDDGSSMEKLQEGMVLAAAACLVRATATGFLWRCGPCETFRWRSGGDDRRRLCSTPPVVVPPHRLQCWR